MEAKMEDLNNWGFVKERQLHDRVVKAIERDGDNCGSERGWGDEPAKIERRRERCAKR